MNEETLERRLKEGVLSRKELDGMAFVQTLHNDKELYISPPYLIITRQSPSPDYFGVESYWLKQGDE